jgi:hypothetical protein
VALLLRPASFDAEGGAYVVGVGQAPFEPAPEPGPAGTYAFVAHFDALGGWRWTRVLGQTPYLGSRNDVAADPVRDRLLVASSFWGTTVLGDDVLASAGDLDALVTVLDEGGRFLWSRHYGDENRQTARSIAVDASGRIVVGGEFQGAVDLGHGPVPSAGERDVFVLKLTSLGEPAWYRTAGDSQDQAAHGVAVRPDDSVVFGAASAGGASFGGTSLGSAGDYDVIVAAYAP